MKYTKEILQEAVKQSKSVANVLRFLGLNVTGGGHAHISKMIKNYEIDTSHFTGQNWNKGQVFENKRKHADEIFNFSADRRQNAKYLVRALLEIGRPYQCEICGNNGIWNNMPLTLQVDHIDGDWKNNKPENLRFMCANCHSQTSTFGSKKRNV